MTNNNFAIAVMIKYNTITECNIMSALTHLSRPQYSPWNGLRAQYGCVHWVYKKCKKLGISLEQFV